MQDTDKKEFAAIMAAMAENFNCQTTKDGLRIRFEALRGYFMDEVRAACVELVRTRKFPGMPNTAEIIEKISGTLMDQAERQANAVIAQIRSVGSYGSPKFSDPVTASLMSSRFRWGEVCKTPEKDLKWFVRDFVSAYKSYSPAVAQIQGKPRAKLIELAGRIGK